MPVVEPMRSPREQLKMGIGFAVVFVLGAGIVGIVLPILLAMIVGKLGGH